MKVTESEPGEKNSTWQGALGFYMGRNVYGGKNELTSASRGILSAHLREMVGPSFKYGDLLLEVAVGLICQLIQLLGRSEMCNYSREK